jgi:hypothetical protein
MLADASIDANDDDRADMKAFDEKDADLILGRAIRKYSQK